MSVATLAEVKAAQAFLRTLGANWRNLDLVHGVVAWFRQESGSISRVLGNNPFNIRHDPSQIGVRHTAHNGDFAIFATLAIGFQAAARLLLRGGNDWRGYGLVVRAARSGRVIDFLTAIAMSAWDAAHYGWTIDHPERNHLIATYNSITGLTLPVSKPDPKHKPKKPKPIPPRDLAAPIIVRNYLDGRAVVSFYEKRPHTVKPLD